ncbi:MAG: hypothetical protein RLZZ242_1040 [Bacteroidota bacterium]|jgi:NAD+ kinase
MARAIAFFGLQVEAENCDLIAKLLSQAEALGFEILIEKNYLAQLDQCHLSKQVKSFESKEDLDDEVALMVSLGGDGTMLRAVTFIGQKGIPLVGVNTGRLGFLSLLSTHDAQKLFERFVSGNYRLEERQLLELTLVGDETLFGGANYALNEVAVSRKDTTSMITIEAWLDDVYLTTYWADGLLVATPTGSTGYSLSCGGPVLTPDAKSLVITPVAPHHLNARPLVVDDATTIRLKVDSREPFHLVSMDSRIETVANGVELRIKKADFTLKTIAFEEDHFFQTLRTKLLWGEDKRN